MPARTWFSTRSSRVGSGEPIDGLAAPCARARGIASCSVPAARFARTSLDTDLDPLSLTFLRRCLMAKYKGRSSIAAAVLITMAATPALSQELRLMSSQAEVDVALDSPRPTRGVASADARARWAARSWSRQGTVTGQVVDAGTQRPLNGAQVSVVGTGLGVITDAAGRYRLANVPAGEAIVRVQLLGYGTEEQAVQVTDGGSVTANFALAEEVLALDEVVVTGIASRTSRARAEVSVSSIDVAELTDKLSYSSLSSLIGGKAAGVSVGQSSGAIGSGIRFKIRGGGGLKGTGQPIIYIDGVRVDNSEVEGVSTGGQGYAVLSSLNPDNIEDINILKGPAAAALYGTSGSNGVVLITTKSGGAVPGEGISVNVKSTVGFNEQLTPYTGHEFLTYQGANHEFRRGAIHDNQIGISGGGQELRYYTSLGRRYEEGILRNAWLDRYSLQANFEVVPADNLIIDVNANYALVTQRAQDLDNAFGPLNNTLFISDQQLFSKTGSKEALYAASNLLDSNRFTGSLNLTWTPVEDFEVQARMGYDGSYLREDQTEPVGFAYGGDANGNRQIFQRHNAQQNYNFNARYSYEIFSGIQTTTVAGVQLFNRRVETTGIEKDIFPAEPLMNIGAGEAFIDADETALHERQAGIFASQQFGYDNTLFFTLAGRQDHSSIVGIEAPAIFYPKVSAAVRLDQMGFTPGPINFLKVRAAYGQSGQLPDLLDGAGRLWGSDAFAYGSGAVLDVIGNPEIEPERVAEFEAGFDAELAETYSVNFTFYRTNASESIIGYQQSPSTGLTADEVPFNIGEVTAWGLEANLGAQLIRTEGVELSTRLLWSYSENEVQDIGEAQPIFDDNNVIIPGLPRAAWYPYQNNGAVFNEDGTYAGADISFTDRVFMGTPYPKHTGALSVDVRLFENLTLYALSEWALDLSIYNSTGLYAERYGNYAKRLRMAAALGEDRFREVWEEEFPNIEQLEPGTPEYRDVANEYALLDAQSAMGFIQAADYFGVGEISVGYDVTELVSSLGIGESVSSARLTASGRNVLLYSLYEGPDPRLHWNGARSLGRGRDFTSLQHPRTWSLSLNLTF